MELTNCTIGFAMTGSFCTIARTIPIIEEIVKLGANVLPIMSQTLATTDTRFGKAADFISIVQKITGNKVITTIDGAEPIGPKKLLDILVVAPCTGNTLSKLANGITDTSVTMATKAQLRNKRPVIIGISTNDGLGANARNIGLLLNTKNIYFVPFGQDDPVNKETSLVCNMESIVPTIESTLNHEQLQPLIILN